MELSLRGLQPQRSPAVAPVPGLMGRQGILMWSSVLGGRLNLWALGEAFKFQS